MIPTFDEVMRFTRTVSGSPALEDAEAVGLYNAFCEVPPGGVVVETGCQLGRSSSLILQMAKAIGFHSVHIDPYTEQPEYLSGWIRMMHSLGGDRTREFTFFCGETAKAAWLLARIGVVDVAFIDGDHEYPGVMTDLAIIGPLIKHGGLLTAHDYANEGLPGVRRALDEYTAGNKIWASEGVSGSLGVWRRK